MEQWNKSGWEGYEADVQSNGLVCVGREVFFYSFLFYICWDTVSNREMGVS